MPQRMNLISRKSPHFLFQMEEKKPREEKKKPNNFLIFSFYFPPRGNRGEWWRRILMDCSDSPLMNLFRGGGGWLIMPLSSLSSLSLNYSALDIIIFIFLVQITHLSISSLAIISPINLLITLVKLVRFVNIMSVSGTNQLGFLPSQPFSSDFSPQITSIIMQFPSVLYWCFIQIQDQIQQVLPHLWASMATALNVLYFFPPSFDVISKWSHMVTSQLGAILTSMSPFPAKLKY